MPSLARRAAWAAKADRSWPAAASGDRPTSTFLRPPQPASRIRLRLERSDRLQCEALGRRRPHDRFRNRCSDLVSTEATIRKTSFSEKPLPRPIRELRLRASGSRSCRTQVTERHQRLNAPDLAEEDAQFGRPPVPDHDGGWGGQPHGAGTGDDQNATALTNAKESAARGRTPATRQRSRGRGDHRGNEPRAVTLSTSACIGSFAPCASPPYG